MKPLHVTYKVYNTPWAINERLASLADNNLMSFDIETKGLYPKEQRKEAIKLLEENNLDTYNHKLASIVANNDGLSFPSLIETTHFVFGLDKTCSIILIPPNPHMEIRIWDWLRNYRGKLLIHNTLFDLKVMYHRISDFPHDYEDTALMLKTLINDSDAWKAKVGLKEQMSDYYPPSWSMYDEYEPEDNKNPKFLEYAAIDGAATYFLYQLILQETSNGQTD